jgi:hypothetical protein
MIFVCTHLVMIICSVGVIYMSVAFGSKDEKEEMKSNVIVTEGPKPMQVTTTFYQATTGYLEAFTKITS